MLKVETTVNIVIGAERKIGTIKAIEEPYLQPRLQLEFSGTQIRLTPEELQELSDTLSEAVVYFQAILEVVQ